MSGLDIQIIVDEDDVKALAKTPDKIEAAAVRMTERLLGKVEDATLITKYTQTARPNKPAGSTYVRTFLMQRSSKKQITRNVFPIEGAWQAKTAYASFVIGKASEQAAIHSGRWPVLELAINQVNVLAPKIWDEELSKEKI